MKRIFALLGAGVSAALILGSQTARAQSCGMECHTEYSCGEEVYPCGTNADGTIMMCSRTVCRPVRVCVPKPCGARPVPDLQGFGESLILPRPLPRPLPDLLIDPQFPELEFLELPELRELPAFSR